VVRVRHVDWVLNPGSAPTFSVPFATSPNYLRLGFLIAIMASIEKYPACVVVWENRKSILKIECVKCQHLAQNTLNKYYLLLLVFISPQDLSVFFQYIQGLWEWVKVYRNSLGHSSKLC